jgi:hypothetical protein
MHFKVVRETSGQLYASSPLQVEPLAQPQSRHEDHPRHRSRTSLATTASTMVASEGVTPASRFARTPSRTKLSRTGRPRGPGSTHSPSRACEWPCTERAVLAPDPGPGDKSDRLRGVGRP